MSAPPELGSIEEQRGVRWSPLTSALVGLFLCDPVLTPFLAIGRAFSELRELAWREELGHYDAEHERVRSGAVWALAISFGRYVLLGGLVLFTTLVESPPTCVLSLPPAVPEFGDEELREVQERLHSENDEVRATAARHLLALDLGIHRHDDVRRLLMQAEQEFPPPRGRAPHIPSVIVRAVASSASAAQLGAPDARFVTNAIQRLYPTLDAAGRSAALEILVEVGDGSDPAGPGAMAVFWSLVRSEEVADPDLHLPIESLAQRIGHSREDGDELLALRPRSPFSSDVLPVVRAQMGELRTPEDLAYFTAVDAIHWLARPRARQRWAQLRRQLEAPENPEGILGHLRRQRAAEEAVAALELLVAMGEPDFANQALRSEDPRVALAGVRLLRRQGQPVPNEVIQRLTREPLVLEELLAIFERAGDVDLAWSMDTVIRARVVRHLAEQRFAAGTIALHWHLPAPPPQTSVFEVDGFDASGQRAFVTVVAENAIDVDAAPGGAMHFAVLEGRYDAARVEAILTDWSFAGNEVPE